MFEKIADSSRDSKNVQTKSPKVHLVDFLLGGMGHFSGLKLEVQNQVTLYKLFLSF